MLAAHGAFFFRILIFVTVWRVMVTSCWTMGSMLREKLICTGPRTWPQLSPVVITAPKVRTSKKLAHIH